MKLNFQYVLTFAGIAAFLAGCAGNSKKQTDTDTGLAADIKQHIAVLANDSLLGRKPFSAGEEKTISYIAAQFKKMGLLPGSNGSYYQDVPMVEIKLADTPVMKVSGKSNLKMEAG